MRYFNMKGEPIDPTEAYRLFGLRNEERIVQQDTIGDVHVSTVLLVLDHQFGNGPPLIFETMIFGGDHDQDQWRYSTREQAVEGHSYALALVKGESDDG